MLNLNDGHKCGGMFCIQTKAFDCVDRGIFLNKLEYYGIRGTAINIIESYLIDCTQPVAVSS